MRLGFVTKALSRSPREDPDELLDDLAKKGAAPDADRKKRGEDEDHVHADSAGMFPVDVPQVQPERELIQGQGGADAEGESGDARHPVRAHSLLDQPDIADQQQDEDAPHQVMDVEAAAGGDVLKRADAGPDQVGDEADEPKRDQKTEGGEEEALAPVALEVERVELGENPQPARNRFRRVLGWISAAIKIKSVRGRADMWPVNETG